MALGGHGDDHRQLGCHTPSVTNASTNEEADHDRPRHQPQQRADSTEVTHFKITNIQHGTLFQSDGTTPINSGDLLRCARQYWLEVHAGDRILATQLSTSRLTSNSDGVGGSAATATIIVTGVADTPS